MTKEELMKEIDRLQSEVLFLRAELMRKEGENGFLRGQLDSMKRSKPDEVYPYIWNENSTTGNNIVRTEVWRAEGSDDLSRVYGGLK